MSFHSEEVAQLSLLIFPEGINSHLSAWNLAEYVFFLICHFTFYSIDHIFLFTWDLGSFVALSV